MTEWQPIETAPKDGTDVLLCSPHRDTFGSHWDFVTIGHYRRHSKAQWNWYGNKGSGVGPVEPTHWMPLPSIKGRATMTARYHVIRATVFTDIAAERTRQIEAEGWTPEHDDEHSGGELAVAAACYAGDQRQHNTAAPPAWPWAQQWWKPSNRRRNLVKAAALIVAEIERLDRAALAKAKP